MKAVQILRGTERLARLDGAGLLGERAAIFGWTRNGTTSPGGSCKLLQARDGWIAINLARPDDVALLPAWIGEGDVSDPWRFLADRVADRTVQALVERARLLSLPVAIAREPQPSAPPWYRIAARGDSVLRTGADRPLVIDLSALWAGPLCTQLLTLCGARVVKVESTRRPDGARYGPQAFFDLLNAEKASVALDFGTADGRRKLRRLVACADIVVESARPRALAQLGVDAEALVRSVPGLTWVSITGYGRREPGAGWVAFGDDAAVSAGLATAQGSDEGGPLFCGDAIADPLTGVHAAASAMASWIAGGGHLLDLALSEVTAHVLAFGPKLPGATVRRIGSGWEVTVGRERAAVVPPCARAPHERARPLGADTDGVLTELGVSC
jgi:hypothetical protein